MARVLLFSDPYGAPPSLSALPKGTVCALVAASIRPHQHVEMRQFAAEFDLRFLVQPKASDPEYGRFLDAVRDLEPDLILVASYSMLIGNDVLGSAPLGGVNLHAALLPNYRGANPIQWAILNEERETGVTMHHMTESFDAGDIIDRQRIPLFPDDTWRDVIERQRPLMERMVREQLPRVLEGRASRREQDEALARHWRRRSPEDGRFDWTLPARRIFDLVRALVAPLPGAFYEHEGKRTVIDRYLPLAEICRMKAAATEGPLAEIGDAALQVVDSDDPEEPLRLVVVGAADGKTLARVSIADMDLRENRAELEVIPNLEETVTDALWPELLVSLRDFVWRELRLPRLDIKVPHEVVGTLKGGSIGGALTGEGVIRFHREHDA